MQCFADVSGRDLSQFMRWYTQAGTPEVVAAPHYDARAKTFRLDVTQTVPPTPGQPTKEPMVIPLTVGLVGRDGADLALALDGRPLARGVVRAEGSRPQLSCSPGSRSGRSHRSTAASRRRSSSGSPSSRTTCASSPRTIRDPFNRWQAVQTLAMSLLTGNVSALRGGAPAARMKG